MIVGDKVKCPHCGSDYGYSVGNQEIDTLDATSVRIFESRKCQECGKWYDIFVTYDYAHEELV